jgi:hypothetical protein
MLLTRLKLHPLGWPFSVANGWIKHYKNISAMNKEQWVSMFREISLTDAQMQQWHQLFELRHPESHQQFLKWLGMPDQEIDRIRTLSRPA